MSKLKMILSIGLIAVSMSMQSCLDDDSGQSLNHSNAVVTVKSDENGLTYFQLDNKTILCPDSKEKLYNGKEVRALLNYEDVSTNAIKFTKIIHINWIDSISTKDIVKVENGVIPNNIGNDPIEVVNDWVTVLEDGYLTLRVRASWGNSSIPHFINLLTGTNSKDPYEVELHHDINGDKSERFGDALIAFRLKGLDFKDGQKLTLCWKSFDGSEKKHVFTLSNN